MSIACDGSMRPRASLAATPALAYTVRRGGTAALALPEELI